MPQTTVLCFGTFDGLHNGHEYFLKQARSLGSRLIVSVARDAHVHNLKNRKPKLNQLERMREVGDLPYVDECRLSDWELGSYVSIEEIQPNIVAIGHDQQALLEDCQKWLNANHSEIEIKQIAYLDAEKKPLKMD